MPKETGVPQATQYIWEEKKKRRIHIVNKYGNTFCRLEHSNWKINTCGITGFNPPKNRKVCEICVQLQQDNDHRRAELNVAKRKLEKDEKSQDKRRTHANRKTETGSFYSSWEWKRLRYSVLNAYGRKCMCCGATDRPIVVDHIKPVRRFPELALEFDNLQVLCNDCNMGKGGWDETDFRAAKELSGDAARHMTDIVRH